MVMISTMLSRRRFPPPSCTANLKLTRKTPKLPKRQFRKPKSCVAGPKPDTCFVDAQGAPLTVQANKVGKHPV